MEKIMRDYFKEELEEIVLTKEEIIQMEKQLKTVVGSGKGGYSTAGCNCQL